MYWASSGVSPSKAERGSAGPGSAWQAKVDHGAARRVAARATDGGTEGLLAFPAILTDGRGLEWPGALGGGMAKHGRIRRGMGCDSSTEGYGPPCCSH
ncbi:MAG: hypothetical protein EBS91_04340 [Betaproteobacteria bacterium]|nr:hypothetical protein [Betaproteobacteria bacterium]NCA23845.1 hypothetical protein [Betaproteobacteria bacterium]